MADGYERGDRTSVYLAPGRLVVSDRPCAVTTVLGSCVAVCLWDVERRVGGVNHFILPLGEDESPQPERYGNLAVPLLLTAVRSLGARDGGLRAKVFGGAALLGLGAGIGARNVEVAEQVLAERGVHVVAGDAGGGRARKLVFHVDDGAAWVWRL
jgi:chemotaxis protein CheD